MATLGPLYPSTVVNDASYGNIAWNSPGNSAGVADNVSSAHTVGYTDSSNYLKGTAFDLSGLPAGATITGFLVEWRVQAGRSFAFYADRVLLGLGTSIGTTNRAGTNTTEFDTAMTWMAYGNAASDLFGLTSNGDTIKTSGLCVAVADLHVNTGFTDTVYSDAIRVTIGYTTAPPRGRFYVVG